MKPFQKILSRLSPVNLQTNIYNEFQRALAVPGSRFPDAILLPEHYGKGLPERVVEILLARLSYRPGAKVLDVGYAFAMDCHLRMIESLPAPKHLSGIDIAKPGYDAGKYYEAMATSDIMTPPFLDGTFDLIWCISTLEHFGMDNSGYTDAFKVDREMDMAALGRMVGLLRTGGSVLVTVPFGKAEDHGWFRNFDITRWRRLLSHAGPVETKELFFRYTNHDGWRGAAPEELAHTGYFDHANAGAAGLAVAHLVKR